LYGYLFGDPERRRLNKMDNFLKEFIPIAIGLIASITFILGVRKAGMSWIVSSMIAVMVFMAVKTMCDGVIGFYLASDWWAFGGLSLGCLLIILLPFIINFFVDRYDNEPNITRIEGEKHD
jgi:hypothetical protein